MKINGADLFKTIFPGFFEREYIRSIPAGAVYEEQILALGAFSPEALPISCPGHVTFGMYQGDMAPVHEAVGSVVKGWLPNFTAGKEIYCAFDGEKIVSFCLLDDFGTYQGLRIGAPGCVGTIPVYRRQGIGLKLVQNATAILKQRGYDLSYIHYTGVGHWYARLGYQTILKWNAQGIME